MEKVNFGVTKRGEEASLYVLENKNNTTIKVTDYGATLVSLLFADKAGVQKDLVLGYDNVTGCEFPYKSRVMPTSEPLKTLKALYMARNTMKWGFFRLKSQ